VHYVFDVLHDVLVWLLHLAEDEGHLCDLYARVFALLGRHISCCLSCGVNSCGVVGGGRIEEGLGVERTRGALTVSSRCRLFPFQSSSNLSDDSTGSFVLLHFDFKPTLARTKSDPVLEDDALDILDPLLRGLVRSGCRGKDGLQSRGGDILVDADSPDPSPGLVDQLDVTRRLRRATRPDRVLRVLLHVEVDPERSKGVKERRDGSVPCPFDDLGHSIVRDRTLERLLPALASKLVVTQRESTGVGDAEEVGRSEGLLDVLGGDFLGRTFREGLDDLVEGHLHATGEVELQGALDEVGDSSLSGLPAGIHSRQ
jgi:hypothetical protein